MEELREIKILPQKLKAARRDMSQKEAAESVGISKQRLWNYENGVGDPPSNVLARLCLLYGVSIASLTDASENFLKKRSIAA